MSFDDVHGTLAALQGYYLAYPLLAMLGYFALFTLLTACCLPGAAVLMLLAGASFGLVWGSVLAVLASTTGATLTMLASRHALRERVTARLGGRLQGLNQGLQRDGAVYMLSLRLLPVIPFVVLNLLSGLSSLPTRTFFWASAVGMLPATVLYVNAGLQLAQVQSLDGLLSAQALGALAALGLLPLLALAWRRKDLV
ncbi:MAG: TVP38/TMEM64 family protein [Comamonadaceae bacterium]|nr:TVP38/TMEM64 family protein [Comamonadaceae bacterium]